MLGYEAANMNRCALPLIILQKIIIRFVSFHSSTVLSSTTTSFLAVTTHKPSTPQNHHAHLITHGHRPPNKHNPPLLLRPRILRNPITHSHPATIRTEPTEPPRLLIRRDRLRSMRTIKRKLPGGAERRDLQFDGRRLRNHVRRAPANEPAAACELRQPAGRVEVLRRGSREEGEAQQHRRSSSFSSSATAAASSPSSSYDSTSETRK